jgi:hypothetical protein
MSRIKFKHTTVLLHQKLHNRLGVTRVTAASLGLTPCVQYGQPMIRLLTTDGHF